MKERTNQEWLAELQGPGRDEAVADLRVFTVLVAAFLLAGCATLTPVPLATPQPPATYQELVQHYAPVVRQGVASDQDYISAADFDGDWIGANNWRNQPGGDLSACVYYSVVESETHWFLFYSFFHPRDYTDDPCEKSDGCHENDMESLQVVVVKNGTPFGHPVVLQTLAHGHIYLYTLDESVKRGTLRVRGRATLEGSHPVVWVETYGHGIHGNPIRLKPSCVVYRVGDVAEVPQSPDGKDVSYRLVSIYDTLWQHRNEVGPGRAFDNPFDYHGHTLPASFDGDDYGADKANTPWGYDQETGKVLARGDWFLDPARALAYHATFHGEFSARYLHNPYLVDLDLLEGR